MFLNCNDAIIRKANRVVKKAESRDAERIVRELGINLVEVPFKTQKGAYKVIERNRYIFINSSLTEPLRSIVIMHEIGHDQLHRMKAKEFHEFSIFDMTANTMEYEANLFAAHILLPDEEILEYIYRGYDVAQIAGTMHSDINLVALKAADLTLRGYPLRPQEHKRNFL